MATLIFWRGEGNAGATWYELRREMQKEQALRSDSGLEGKDCRWGRAHRNNMCLSRIQLHVIRARTVEYSLVHLIGICASQTRQVAQEYNHERTHPPLNDMTPAEFIRRLKKGEYL